MQSVVAEGKTVEIRDKLRVEFGGRGFAGNREKQIFGRSDAQTVR